MRIKIYVISDTSYIANHMYEIKNNLRDEGKMEEYYGMHIVSLPKLMTNEKAEFDPNKRFIFYILDISDDMVPVVTKHNFKEWKK